MTAFVDSKGKLSDSCELKIEMVKDQASPSEYKAEAVIKQILGNDRPGPSADRPLSREIEKMTDVESDLPIGDEDQPSENLLWEGWLGSEGGKSSSMASSCNSEAILLTESREPSKSKSAPPAPPRNRLKESRTSSREGFSERRSTPVLSLEESWRQFQKFAVKSASQSIQRRKPTETPPNYLSKVTDMVVENKSRILGGASVGLGTVSLAASVGGPVGLTGAAVVGLGASGVNFAASEAGRRLDRAIEDLNAQIKELDDKILRTLEQSPSSEEMKGLMSERELLGQERDQAIEKRRLSLTIERGSSIVGLVNLGASVTALPGTLVSAADAVGSAGNALTVYGGVSDVADMVKARRDRAVRAVTNAVENVFGSKSEEKSPVAE